MSELETNERIGPKVKAISNTFFRIANSSMAELGLTGAQSFVMGYLAMHVDDLPCQHDIEMRFNIKHPTATGILKRLSQKGIVEFRPDGADKRLKRIALTERGVAAAKQTKARLDDMETRLTKDFSDNELLQLHKLLNKLVDNAKSQYSESSKEGDKADV